jgi:hypothetical protein
MKGVFILILCFWVNSLQSQVISYSALESSNEKSSSFDIIGRFGKQLLIYRNIRGRHYISIFNNDMSLVRKMELDFLPRRVLKVEFLKVDKELLLFYQHEKNRMLFCSLVKFNTDIRVAQEPETLDSVVIADNRDIGLYNILQSQHNARIMVIQPLVNTEQIFEINTHLYDDKINLLKQTKILIGSPGGAEMIRDFTLANNGDLVFSRAIPRSETENLRRVDILIKPAYLDTIRMATVRFGDLSIQNLKLQVDNLQKRILVAGLFARGKKSDVEGFFSAGIRMDNNSIAGGQNTFFSDSLRNEVKIRNNIERSVFNEFIIDEIIPYTNGGYALVMEKRYAEGGRGTERLFNPYLDNSLLGRMQYNDFLGNGPVFTMTNTPYNPFRLPIDPKSILKNISGNLLVCSMDSSGLMQEVQLLRKSQSEENTSTLISYFLMKNGSDLKFLFNQKEKAGLMLNATSWKAGERIRRLPALKDLRTDYRYITRYSKQIAVNELIIPCLNNSFLSFARIQF